MKQKESLSTKKRLLLGKMAALIGMVINLFLSAGKITVGYLFHSISVVADGWNNLSDTAASLILFLGFKFSEKPADKEHPYGHARFEYLSSLAVSMLILVIGFELASESVKKILHPEPIFFSLLLIAALAFSVVAKLALMLFYGVMEKKLDSDALFSAKTDSRNDAVTTLAVIGSVLVERVSGYRIDGAVCAILSLFILFGGIKLAKKSISPLLGEGGDPEMKKKLCNFIESDENVIACHDLIIHDYGPGKRYASIHVEMNQNLDPLVCHEVLDRLERNCLETYAVHLVTHLDPIAAEDPETERLRCLTKTLLQVKDKRLEIHDFRAFFEKDKTRLVFDVTLPEELRDQQEELIATLKEALDKLEEKEHTLLVTLDLHTS